MISEFETFPKKFCYILKTQVVNSSLSMMNAKCKLLFWHYLINFKFHECLGVIHLSPIESSIFSSNLNSLNFWSSLGQRSYVLQPLVFSIHWASNLLIFLKEFAISFQYSFRVLWCKFGILEDPSCQFSFCCSAIVITHLLIWW